MTIDSAMAAALARQKALVEADGGVPTTLAGNRAQQERLFPFWNEDAPPVATVVDLTIPGPGGPLAARLYRPDDAPADTLVLFLHGGGWARGSVATGDWGCRALAAGTGFAVLSLAYRLAPEHPFPAAILDIRAAAAWCRTEGAGHGIGAERLFLTGTSAGGNLSLTAALAMRDAGEPLPSGLGLFYGVFGDDLATPSYQTYGPGQYGLSYVRMKQYFEWYVPAGGRTDDPLVSPMHADLAGLPPVWLGIPELDVLRDDAIGLEPKLRAAGVRVTTDYYPDLTHGFAAYARLVPKARAALSDAAHFFRGIAR